MLPLVLCAALTACRTTDLAVYNLNEVHHPDGTPRRKGNVHGPLQHVFEQVLDLGEFGKPAFLEDDVAVRIKDPLGVCLENVSSLLGGDLEDPWTRTAAVQTVSWLVGDCTYRVTRERCAEALAELGQATGAVGPERLAEGASPATPEEVAAVLEELLRAARPALQIDAFGLSGDTFGAVIDEGRALALDRDGLRRVVAVTNILLRRRGYDAPELAPVLEFHRELLARSVGFGLDAALKDTDGRVRSAAIASWIRLSRGEDPAPYVHAFLVDGSEGAVLAGVRGLARHGAPVPAGTPEDETWQTSLVWMERILPLLRRIQEGPVQVAACRAMARLSGLEPDLHPEVWVAWWEELQAGATVPDLPAIPGSSAAQPAPEPGTVPEAGGAGPASER